MPKFTEVCQGLDKIPSKTNALEEKVDHLYALLDKGRVCDLIKAGEIFNTLPEVFPGETDNFTYNHVKQDLREEIHSRKIRDNHVLHLIGEHYGTKIINGVKIKAVFGCRPTRRLRDEPSPEEKEDRLANILDGVFEGVGNGL